MKATKLSIQQKTERAAQYYRDGLDTVPAGFDIDSAVDLYRAAYFDGMRREQSDMLQELAQATDAEKKQIIEDAAQVRILDVALRKIERAIFSINSEVLPTVARKQVNARILFAINELQSFILKSHGM